MSLTTRESKLKSLNAAFAALTHGLTSKWTYLCRTTPGISQLMIPIDNILRSEVILALTGRPPPNELELDLFALPAKLGGLGIGIPSRKAVKEYSASMKICKALIEQILSASIEYTSEVISSQLEAKAGVRKESSDRSTKEANHLVTLLPDTLKTAVDLTRERGSSIWLTALPLQQHGFTLHKGAFHDAIALRYGWNPSRMPTTCACGKKFTVEHAFSCAKGGFTFVRHNELRDLTATLLTEVAHDVKIEPELQPITNEGLQGASASSQDGARLDIVASGVWGGHFERTFFDVRVFNPLASSNRQASMSDTFRRHEAAKKRAYDQRIREVDHATFTPLVFSATGGLGSQADIFYKRLASLLSEKWDFSYSSTICWLRCRLAFSLLRSAIQSIRGARSSRGHAVRTPPVIDLVNLESKVSTDH